MMPLGPPRDVRAIIELLGVRTLAGALQVPVKHVAMMRHRNIMSARHWAATAALAQSVGRPDISMELLADLWRSQQDSRRSA
jgi:hypothetical protein